MINRIGQKIVCIRDWENPIPPACHFPVKGNVYTVRELLMEGAEPSLRVFELRNPAVFYTNMVQPVEPAFVRWAFRPVATRPTDISIFKEILEPLTPEKVA